MTHLLCGGGVPRVHRARSPVPPRLPHFATPRSVHRLAAVAAGTYRPRCPPDVWSPGVTAPPGPCYWLVASGTPVGWRGGCLALGLVRGVVRHYCLGGCSTLVVWARRSGPVRGGRTGPLVSCPPSLALPAPRVPRCVWRAVPSGCPLPSLAGTPFHAVCAFRGLGPVASLVFPACPSSLCALTLPRGPRSPPPPPAGVARALRAVHVLGAGRAVPLGACPSALPAPVPGTVWFVQFCFGFFCFCPLGGGGARSCSPPTWLEAVCPLWGGPARLWPSRAGEWAGGGGAACVVVPRSARPGASGAGGRLASVRPSAFPGEATKRVFCTSLLPLRAWPPYRSCLLVVFGRGPCGALVRRRGFACPSRLLRQQAAGAWRRALLRLPSRAPRSCRGEGGSLPLPRGGWGPAFPWLAGRSGG